MTAKLLSHFLLLTIVLLIKGTCFSQVSSANWGHKYGSLVLADMDSARTFLIGRVDNFDTKVVLFTNGNNTMIGPNNLSFEKGATVAVYARKIEMVPSDTQRINGFASIMNYLSKGFESNSRAFMMNSKGDSSKQAPLLSLKTKAFTKIVISAVSVLGPASPDKDLPGVIIYKDGNPVLSKDGTIALFRAGSVLFVEAKTIKVGFEHKLSTTRTYYAYGTYHFDVAQTQE